MILLYIKRLGRRWLGKRSWYQRLGYRWQMPAPAQPLAYDPFVFRLCPPTTEQSERTRHVPYILRGRNEEMTEIAQRLFDPRGSLSVVEGPPGIGKTSLMEAIGHYAENQGFAWIRLHRLDLCNFQRFNKAMLRSNPVVERTVALVSGLRARVDLQDIAEIEVGGESRSKPLVGDAYATIRRALRKHVHARGLLITIDDGRGVLHNHPQQSAERLIVLEILSTINDGLGKKVSSVPAVTIIGGVTGTISEVQEAVSMRLADAHYIVLDKIPLSSVRATIEDCLRITEPVSGLKPAKFPAEFIHECAERCYGHPLHATAVGRSLQEIGMEFTKLGRTEVTLADVEGVRQSITERMEDSYRTRFRNITHRDAEVMCDLARAITKWGPRIGVRAADRLVQESGTRVVEKVPADGDEHQPANWLDHLCNKGLVVAYEPTTRYPRVRHMKFGAGYVEVDLPSFAAYFATKQTRASGMLSEEELAELVPPEDRNLPAWDWPEAGKWHPIEQLAPPPHGNPYVLEPILPGDNPEPALATGDT